VEGQSKKFKEVWTLCNHNNYYTTLGFFHHWALTDKPVTCKRCLKRTGELGDWETLVKKTTREEMKEFHGMEDDELDMEFYDVEISIIKKDNEYGHESYGGAGPDKIILPVEEECDQEEFDRWLKRANAVCRVLNDL